MSHQQSISITLKITTMNKITETVCSQTSGLQLKTIVFKKRNLNIQKIKLVFQKKIVQDHQTIGSLGIQKSATIMVLINNGLQYPKTLNKNANQLQFFNQVLSQGAQYEDLVFQNEHQHFINLKPQDQQTIEKLANDPDEFIKQIQRNPTAMQMLLQSPFYKSIWENPEQRKVFFNSEFLKMGFGIQKKQMLTNLNTPTMPAGCQGSMSGNNQQIRKEYLEQKYKSQLEWLAEVGQNDKQKNIQMLEIYSGDVDKVFQVLNS